LVLLATLVVAYYHDCSKGTKERQSESNKREDCLRPLFSSSMPRISISKLLSSRRRRRTKNPVGRCCSPSTTNGKLCYGRPPPASSCTIKDESQVSDTNQIWTCAGYRKSMRVPPPTRHHSHRVVEQQGPPASLEAATCDDSRRRIDTIHYYDVKPICFWNSFFSFGSKIMIL
jgi:hypothetical protein